jgi:hypothetical protein
MFKVLGKRQQRITNQEFDKFFRFAAFILDRRGDLDSALNNIQTIASELEDELSLHYGGTNDLKGMGTHANVRGGPIVELGETIIDYRESDDSIFTVLATVEGVINIVTT